jgi:CDP-diacylglycerol--glycerol-3-phosphate 3-phosphatidyltransferase
MSHRQSYRIPNLIIVGRVALAFIAAGLLVCAPPAAAGIGVPLIVIVIALDAADGIVARHLGVPSKLGAVLDITADRIVEHVFWVTFAVTHVVALWVPLVVLTRSFIVDAARGLALAQGKTAFGTTTMARSGVTRFLTASRMMRNAYGAAKVVAFVLLGGLVTLSRLDEQVQASLSQGALGGLERAAALSVLAAVALCIARGVPVLIDARAYVSSSADPSAWSP